jgi:hypothetical protein
MVKNIEPPTRIVPSTRERGRHPVLSAFDDIAGRELEKRQHSGTVWSRTSIN